jgi:hypothetical protein
VLLGDAIAYHHHAISILEKEILSACGILE